MNFKSLFRNTILLLGIISLVVFACKKEEEEKKPIQLKTNDVENITAVSAKLIGTISNLGSGVIDHGFYYSTTAGAEKGEQLSLGSTNSTGEFSVTIEDLTPNETYYIKAYGFNGEEYSYGEELAFTTFDGVIDLSIKNIFDISAKSVKIDGAVVSNGHSELTEWGFCWSQNTNPSIDNEKIQLSSGFASYTAELKDLIINTQYYIRLYGVNAAGISYSEEKTFSTLDGLPIVLTNVVEDVKMISAIFNGNVTDDLGFEVTEKGFVWSKTPNPELTNNFQVIGNDTGEFRTKIKILEPNTNYYLRAFATNKIGTSYGEEMNFITKIANEYFVDYRDTNEYRYVTIGNQIWMAENLNAIVYPNGSPIPEITSDEDWGNLGNNNEDDAYRIVETSYGVSYGPFYTWAAAMNDWESNDANPSGVQGVCPDGWHLPSHSEWSELRNFIISDDIESSGVGTALNATSSNDFNGNYGSDLYGFSSMEDGHILNSGIHFGSVDSWFWAATSNSTDKAYIIHIEVESDMGFGEWPKSYGMSIRCIKD